MSYIRTSGGSSGDIAVTVFTSVLTSAFITFGILFFTGNLIPPEKPTEDPATNSPADEQARPTAPSLKGLTPEVAGEVLRARDLRLVVQEERPDDEVPKGKIAEQDPLPNSELKPGGAVAVVVSTGLASTDVPDVIGKTKDEAEQLIRAAGFTVGAINEVDTGGTPGTVAQTTPAKGETAKSGSAVTLAVTRGVTVPKVVGKYLSRARKDIDEAGLKVGRIRWGDTDALDSNVVMRQEPDADTVVLPGSEIILTVNSE